MNTHPEQWAAIYAAVPGEQLGVQCLAQGHLSRGIEGGESAGLQAGQFSTRTPLLRSHAVVIAAVCGYCPAEIHKAFPEIDVIWRGAYVALKTLYTFQHS